MAVNIKIIVFWNVMPCSLADKYITNVLEETACSSETSVPTYQTTQQAGVAMANEAVGTCGTYGREEKHIQINVTHIPCTVVNTVRHTTVMCLTVFIITVFRTTHRDETQINPVKTKRICFI
jgi:hypothetical protein